MGDTKGRWFSHKSGWRRGLSYSLTALLLVGVGVAVWGGLSRSKIMSAFAAAPAKLSSKQTVYEAHSIRVSVSSLSIEHDSEVVELTLRLENLAHDAARIAALQGRAGADAVLSDEAGNACNAEPNPVGVVQLPNLKSATDQGEAMTSLPAMSRTNIVFQFTRCRMSPRDVTFFGALLFGRKHSVWKVQLPLWGLTVAEPHRDH